MNLKETLTEISNCKEHISTLENKIDKLFESIITIKFREGYWDDNSLLLDAIPEKIFFIEKSEDYIAKNGIEYVDYVFACDDLDFAKNYFLKERICAEFFQNRKKIYEINLKDFKP